MGEKIKKIQEFARERRAGQEIWFERIQKLEEERAKRPITIVKQYVKKNGRRIRKHYRRKPRQRGRRQRK